MRSWSREQLWIATLFLALAAAAVLWSYHAWETSFQDRGTDRQKLFESTMKYCQAVQCDMSRDPAVLNAMQRVNAWMNEAVIHAGTRQWVRPIKTLVAFFLVPVLILGMHWRWHAVRRP